VKDMPETELILINRDLWEKLQKTIADYDFTVKDLVEWILRDVDLDEYAKELDRKVKFELEASKEDRREDEREAEEETSTDEERVEEADEEAENFGKY
jgi:hypothetical protein